MRRAQAKISALKITNDYHKIIPIRTILSDHGTQFTSQIWKDILNKHNIKISYSSIRHPESNPTERVMKELSRLFRVYCQRSHAGWANHIENIETLFNSTPHTSTGYSLNQILYGKNPPDLLNNIIIKLLPTQKEKAIDEIRNEVRKNLTDPTEKRARPLKKYFDKFKINDLVLLRNNNVSDAASKKIYKFCPLYSGPFKIIKIPYPNVYTLSDPINNDVKGNYNIHNLKLFHTYFEKDSVESTIETS